MRRWAAVLWALAALSTWVLPADVLVLNLDRDQTDSGPDPHSSAPVIRDLLQQMGFAVTYREVSLHDHATLAQIDYDAYGLVAVAVGVNCLFQHAHRFDAAEGQRLVDYLNRGGRVYMEGGDVWYQDPKKYGAFNFCAAFGINYSQSTDGGAADLWHISGLSSAAPVTAGLLFDYGQDNCFIDLIERQQGLGTRIFKNIKNDPPNYTEANVAVARDTGTYRTIASSFEFGGLADGAGNNTKRHLLEMYLDFFGVEPGGARYGDVDGSGSVTGADLLLLADYLAENADALPVALSLADLDLSGAVDGVDLAILDHFLAGHIPSLPFSR
jgi:hypothetical protein